MNSNQGKYMRRCYELAISAGKKGFDTFGAVLVYDGKILEEAENTADFKNHIFGHAEFNLVHKCANKYSDEIMEKLFFILSSSKTADLSVIPRETISGDQLLWRAFFLKCILIS